MSETRKLRLHAQVLLLVLRAKEGTVAGAPMYQYAVAGGILAELLLAKRLGVKAGGRKGKKWLVHLNSTTSTSDAVLDECLSKVKAAGKPKSPGHWVVKFASTGKLKRRVAARLVDLGILRADRKKVLWVFDREIFPEVDHSAETEIVSRLEIAIFTDSPEVDQRTILLVSLLYAADILKLVFDKKRLKPRKDRITTMIDGEVVGRATREAIESVRTTLALTTGSGV